MVPQGEDAQSRSPIVESAGSSSPDLVSGEQTDGPRCPAAPVPCEGGEESGRPTRKQPTKWRRTECRQTKPLVSCVAPTGFVCFYPQDKPRPLISQHLTSRLRSDHAGAMAEEVVIGRRPGHSKPGFRRLRLSRAATKTPLVVPEVGSRSGRNPKELRGRRSPCADLIQSRELFQEICAQCCRRGA